MILKARGPGKFCSSRTAGTKVGKIDKIFRKVLSGERYLNFLGAGRQRTDNCFFCNFNKTTQRFQQLLSEGFAGSQVCFTNNVWGGFGFLRDFMNCVKHICFFMYLLVCLVVL